MDDTTRLKVCRLIAGLVVVDDDLDPAEEAFIDKLLKRFDLPDGRDALFPIMDGAEAAKELADLAPALQQEAFDLLVQAAAADKKYADEERAYLEQVAKVLGISSDEVGRKVARAISG